MRLFKRASAKPLGAFSVKPSGNFLENDGFWSTFTLHVGCGAKGPQNFETVVSTSSFDTWLALPAGCSLDSNPDAPKPPSDCLSSRGVGLFEGANGTGYDGGDSSTGTKYGDESIELGAEPQPAEIFGNDYNGISGELWADFIQMDSSSSDSTSRMSSDKIPIFGMQSWLYYASSLGVGIGAHQTTKPNVPNINSTIKNMAYAGAIPGRAWAYTAGSIYEPRRLGSLVLGGYDRARLNAEKSASFALSLGTVQSSVLQATVAPISIQYQGAKSDDSTKDSFQAIIDSTLPYLFLPKGACQTLAKLLNLEYDVSRNLYTITQENVVANKGSIKSISIGLGPVNGGTSSPGVTITFPYQAFEANASWTWGWQSPQPIFPMRNATSDDTAVLGRVFFQEAYVSADFEHGNFSVSQASQATSSNLDLVNIYNGTTTADSSGGSSGLPPGAIAGIAIGGVAVLVAIAFFVWLFNFRGKRQPKDESETEKHQRPPVGRERSNTVESMMSEETAISELPSDRHSSNMRPILSHRRQQSGVSELSTDSEHEGGRRPTVGTLAYIDEMEHKCDAAELEALAQRNQQHMTPPSELEGDHRWDFYYPPALKSTGGGQH